MKKKRKTPKPVFKEYNQDQLLLIPPSLEELIPKNHVVRTINKILDSINLDKIISKYRGGGCSSYHPRMLIKVMIYAYTQKIYSSRFIAKALRENIQFMWLSGGNKPDFRTINRFRSTILKDSLEPIFRQVVEVLLKTGYISMENYFLDGTKIEADANKYSFVWKKSTIKYKSRLQEKVSELLDRIDVINTDENDRYGDKDLEELGEALQIDSVLIEKAVQELNDKLEKLEESEETDEQKNISDDMEKYLKKMKEYEGKEKICGKRNSYSKTDHDATFMRMKEDHMRNGQLKAGYNVQIGTENQFIIGYSIHQKPTDTTTLIPHLEKLKTNMRKFPKNIIADAGYGSEENYSYLEECKIRNFVKFNYFYKEQKRKFKNDPFQVENLEYNVKNDEYVCPAGKILRYTESRKRITDNGYEQNLKVYVCEDCRWCRTRIDCHKSKYNRKIEINERLNQFKIKARKNLFSEKGLELRRKRSVDVESVFGQIKHNRGFRKFMLRGLNKVNIEWGLISLAHNFLKMNSLMA